MPSGGRGSNCSSTLHVDFYWINLASLDQNGHIEAAVDALFASIEHGDGRVWNPHTKQAAKAEFRGRLRLACRGSLRPVDEVKGLRDGRWPIFEIRWKAIRVVELHDGKPRYRSVHVRLIHAEPEELGLCVLGLHAHEKPTDSDARARQDAEIDAALQQFWDGYSDTWGVTRLAH